MAEFCLFRGPGSGRRPVQPLCGSAAGVLARGILVAVLLLIGCATAAAQQTTALCGTVTDESGAVIPGAQVSASLVGSGQKTENVADAAGAFPGLRL